MNTPQKQYQGRKYRKPYRKNYGKNSSLDYKIRSTVKKEIMKTAESKVADRNNTAFNIDYNGSSSIFSLINVARGDGPDEFIGDEITLTKLRLKWAVQAIDQTNLIRCTIIQDVSGGGVPTVGTLYESAGTVNTPLSPFNLNYRNTYKVLYDEFFATAGNTTSGNSTNTSHISGDISIPMWKLRKISFQSSTNTVTAGGIYIVFVSDSSNISTPVGQYYSRIYYKDF